MPFLVIMITITPYLGIGQNVFIDFKQFDTPAVVKPLSRSNSTLVPY